MSTVPDELLARVERAVRAARCAGAQQAEVYAWSARSWETREAGGLRTVQEADESGVSARVEIDGRRATATTSGTRETDLQWAIERALAIARLMPRTDAPWALPPAQALARPPTRVDADLAEPNADRLMGAVQAANDAIGRAPGLDYSAATIVTHAGRFVVGNTNGVLAWDQNAHESFTIEVRGDDQGESRTMRTVLQERRPIERAHDLADVAERAAAMALAPGEAGHLARPVETLVLDAQCMWQIVQGIIPSFAGSAANEGRSWFASRLGQSIASPLVTMIDDPWDGLGVRNHRCDDQGAPSSGPLLLVEHGVLRHHAHDAASAAAADAPPTGHGLRPLNARYATPAKARVGNVVVEGGPSDAAVVEDAARAVLVSGSLLGSFTMNPLTGDISCTATLARLVERGKDAGALKPVTIGGNVFDVLQQIEAFGRTMQRFPRGSCSSARVSGLTAST